VKKPVWIEEADALAIHERLISLHGGPAGLHDPALLKSALARRRQHFAYGSLDMVELAAIYTSGIVRNHAFIEGNKRTGFVIGVLFLESNGYRFTASEEEAAQSIISLAAGDLDEKGYAAFLRANASRTRK
jgi:death on curing protein